MVRWEAVSATSASVAQHVARWLVELRVVSSILGRGRER